MKTKRILSGLLGFVMAISATISTISATVSAVDPGETFDDLNQSSITEAMQPGWNLGNQLEAVSGTAPSETAWGNPVIKRELLHTVKLAGFKSVRIPVSYLTKIGEVPDYTIDPSWLARIKQVVDYAIDEGLYVIINMHGDGYNSMKNNGAWLFCNAPDDQQPAIKEKYGACWKQIANVFKDYDEHLIFESMNEEFNGSYSDPIRSQYANINAYNQIFIDTVRQTGGNNDKRWLLICGWNTDIDYTYSDYGFELPTDTFRNSEIKENRIMLSVHYYAPWDFCGDGTDTNGITQWGNDADPEKSSKYNNNEEFMDVQIQKVYNKFVQKGYPVVIGEYGCINKSAADPENTKFRAHFDQKLCECSKKYGCIPVYWDNGAIGNSFGLINRITLKVEQQEIVDGIVNVFLSAKERLNLAITSAEEIDENLYLPDSWQSFSDVLNSVKDVYNKEESSDSDCTDAISKLKTAIADLKPNPEVLVETKIITEPQISSSKNTEEDNYIQSISNTAIDFSKFVNLKITFTVNGEVSDDTYAFILKPYCSANWSGWDPNIIYVKDCTEDNGVYTAIIDAQAILATYSGSPNLKPDGINLYYGASDPEITLTSVSALSAQGDRHVHSYKVVNRKENTCIELGKCDMQCSDSDCNETYSTILNFGSHKYVSETTTPATCTEKGVRTNTCSVCNDSYTTELPAKGHRFVDGVCTVCGENDPDYVSPSNPTNPSNISPTTPTSPKAPTTAPTTANAEKAAKAKVKNAKIKNLSVKSKSKKISVSWKKVKKVNGYQVQVSKKKNFKGKNIVLKKFTTKTKLTVKGSKIKKGKTYYVRVRTYATYKNSKNKPNKVYGKFSKKLKVTVK